MRLFNRVSLATPESVELDLILAGIGNRAYALFIDYILWSLILLIFSIAWSFLSIELVTILQNQFGLEEDVYLWLISIWMLIFFTIYVGYFVFFETVWQGQTPGKKFTKIRVICEDGRPIRLQQATLRALLRPLDDFLYIGAFLIILNSREKRLGDWLAGTLVIQESQGEKNPQIKLSERANAWVYFLRNKTKFYQLLPEDFAVVREYLRRREQMVPGAQSEVSRQLANQVKAIIELETMPEKISANLFLEAVYLAYQNQRKDENSDSLTNN